MEKSVINFFACEELVEESLFGLCDDVDEAKKTPAYVDRDKTNEKFWGARVSNSSGMPVGFIAVDNKIEIRRPNGEMENRCDAMLHNENHLIFVELKDQQRDWIEQATKQLSTTIKIFKQHHDIGGFSRRVAYACNKKHPQFKSSHKDYMEAFRQNNGVRLVICRDITIK